MGREPFIQGNNALRLVWGERNRGEIGTNRGEITRFDITGTEHRDNALIIHVECNVVVDETVSCDSFLPWYLKPFTSLRRAFKKK
jgi:hypothetical protein